MLKGLLILLLFHFAVLEARATNPNVHCQFNQGICSHPHNYVQDYGYGGFTSSLIDISSRLNNPLVPQTNPECIYNPATAVMTGAARLWNGAAAPATMIELQSIQCAGEDGKNYRINGGSLTDLVHTTAEMDNLQEELVFLTAIDNVRQFNDCQDGLFRQYFDPKSQAHTELLTNAWTQFNEISKKLKPKLVEELSLRKTRVLAETHLKCTRESGCGAANIETVRAVRESGSGLDKNIQGKREEINAILSRIPMANRDSMRAAMENLMLTNGPVTQSQFNEVFDREMHRLYEGVQQTKSFINGITIPLPAHSKERLYCVDRNLKENLYRSGQVDHTIKQMGLEDILKNFSLRSQNRYGLAGTVVTEVALIPTYFVGYGAARLALRAGASSVRAIAASGRVLSTTTRFAMLGMEGLDYGSAISGAMADCQSDDFMAQVDGRSCDPSQELGQVYQEASMAQCLTSAILPFASPLVGTSVRLANSRGLRKLYGGLEVDSDLVEAAKKSGILRLISSGNEDLVEKFLLKGQQSGKSSEEVSAALTSLIEACPKSRQTVCVQNALAYAVGENSRFVSKIVYKKYNAKTVSKLSFTKAQLAKLRDYYHNLEVPAFVRDFMKGPPADAGYLKWTDDRESILVFNTPGYPKNFVANKLRAGQARELKNSDQGLLLNSWYVHPGMRKNPDGSMKISDLDKSGTKFLASILDLTSADLPHLKRLKAKIAQELKDEFGVNSRDATKLYFHFPIAPETVGLHLHIRVNNPTHGLESNRSFELDEIITQLERGGSVDDLILRRQQNTNGFYTNPGATRRFLESFGGEPLEQVPNPFRDERIRQLP